jgi:prevent-host-death family protein
LTNQGERPTLERVTTVNVYEAKARLSALIAEAEQGGDVIIAKAGRPAVRLVPVSQRTTPRLPGSMRGRISIADDFDAYDSEIVDLFADPAP